MQITTFISTHRKLLIGGFLLVILILLATLPFYGPDIGVRENLIFKIATIFMYTTLAVAWAMFSGVTGYMSLAPAAFFGLGIYITALLWGELPAGVVILAASIGCFIFAMLVGLVTLRLKGIYFAIFTFGLVFLISYLFLYYELKVLHQPGHTNNNPISTQTMYFIMLGVAVATLLAAYFLRRSRLGLAMRSIGGNEAAAAHMGIDTTMVKVLTFAITAIFMGAAGATYGAALSFIDPATAFSLDYSFKPILMAIFGGMGVIYGPVIGAIVFPVLEFQLSSDFPFYFPIIFGVILVLTVLYLPSGVAGPIQRLGTRLWTRLTAKGGEAEQYANN